LKYIICVTRVRDEDPTQIYPTNLFPQPTPIWKKFFLVLNHTSQPYHMYHASSTRVISFNLYPIIYKMHDRITFFLVLNFSKDPQDIRIQKCGCGSEKSCGYPRMRMRISAPPLVTIALGKRIFSARVPTLIAIPQHRRGQS
jgi:hypothetical protein